MDADCSFSRNNLPVSCGNLFEVADDMHKMIEE